MDIIRYDENTIIVARGGIIDEKEMDHNHTWHGAGREPDGL